MGEQSKPPSPEDAAKARAIFEGITRDAEKNRAEQDQAIRSITGAIFAAPLLDELERTKTAELTAICNAHAAAVEPIQAGIDSNMNPAVLAGLLNCNQAFLGQLAGFQAAAQELESKGRPQLAQTLKAWMHDAQATSSLIQYVLHTRPAANPLAAMAALGGAPPVIAAPAPWPAPTPAPVPAPAPAPAQLSLPGIWDLVLPDGRRVELAMDAKSFSYAISDGSFAYWGTWYLYPQAGAPPLICLTRAGGYPVAYYGPLGNQAIYYAANETWGINSFEANKVTFRDCSMVRRQPIPLPSVTARISQVQAQFEAADARDKSYAANFIAQRNIIASTQSAMWDYINSGAGRPK